MPDITMCQDDSCIIKATCYRFMAVPSEYRQSYFAGSVRNDLISDDLTEALAAGGIYCSYFMPVRPMDVLRVAEVPGRRHLRVIP